MVAEKDVKWDVDTYTSNVKYTTLILSTTTPSFNFNNRIIHFKR